MMDYGTRTLFVKEVRRFLRVPGQTLLAPVVTTALYLVVFGLALGGRTHDIRGVPATDFLLPGLVTLGVATNAFFNTASSMMIMKMQGTVVDLLVTPLAYWDIVTAMVGAATLRAMAVGLLTWTVAIVGGGPLAVTHPFYALAFPTLTSVAFSAIGLLAGIWADKFEQVNIVPNFVVTPLVFLGGVFYDIARLPPTLRWLSRANPIHFLVEGTRYGFSGTTIVNASLALGVLAMVTVALLGACALLLRAGWKLRA